MDKYIVTKTKWLDRINILAYEGDFKTAYKLIQYGLKNGLKLIDKDATDILSSCGPDLRKWFIIPLMEIGGQIPDNYIKMAKRILRDKNSASYKIWSQIPDVVEGFEYIVEFYNNKTADYDFYNKYLKYKNKYINLKKNIY